MEEHGMKEWLNYQTGPWVQLAPWVGLQDVKDSKHYGAIEGFRVRKSHDWSHGRGAQTTWKEKEIPWWGGQLGNCYNTPGKGCHGNGEERQIWDPLWGLAWWHLAAAWTWLREQPKLPCNPAWLVSGKGGAASFGSGAKRNGLWPCPPRTRGVVGPLLSSRLSITQAWSSQGGESGGLCIKILMEIISKLWEKEREREGKGRERKGREGKEGHGNKGAQDWTRRGLRFLGEQRRRRLQRSRRQVARAPSTWEVKEERAKIRQSGCQGQKCQNCHLH